VARAVALVAGRCGTTHVVMGVPHLRRRFGRPALSLVDEIVAARPSLHIGLVGDPRPAPPI